MEALVKGDSWRGRRVFLTGHTGFKGSWLALWLADMGAEVTGYALPAPTNPSLFDRARLTEVVRHIEGDIRDLPSLERAMLEAKPDVVFHLAAQPLVRLSYAEPVDTYSTNVMGTVHVLDCIRRVTSVSAAVCITSDKCYENKEWTWPYRESDPMGGHDPYSNSKGCSELIVSAYRRSFLSEAGTGLASVRAGNVIGGGDWAADRLVPDLIRAFEAGQRPLIRSPHSVRPWQHVLEALSGYIMIAERLMAGSQEAATGWNFGPSDDDAWPVERIVNHMMQLWGLEAEWDRPDGIQPHEANLLRLDCSKARSELGWRPALTLADALLMIVEWHQTVAAGADARDITLKQIRAYRQLAERKLDNGKV